MEKELGYLQSCIDRRFVEQTRKVFEKETGLGEEDYWHETNPGGAALDISLTGVTYAVKHGAVILGWQAHGDGCGGQPDVSDQEIQDRLDKRIVEMKERFPGLKHIRIFVTESTTDIKEV